MIPQCPCIGICTIEDNGVEDVCIGCGRTMDEITNYPIINTPENIAKRNKINKQALIRLAS